MNLPTFIANTTFFKGLPPACCRLVAERTTLHQYQKNAMLFSEGERGQYVYILASGMVKLSKMTVAGVEGVVRIIQAGEMFAEVVLYESCSYPVTATALSPIEAARIPCRDMDILLEDETFRKHFIALLFKKQRQLTSQLQELKTLNARARFFLFLRSHFGTENHLTIHLSKKEMAASVGITPEAFSRLIYQLKKDGSITWEGRTLQIHTTLE